MTTRKATLGELETLMLLAVLRLEDRGSVRSVRVEMAERGGRELSRGATYATLTRLERKGYLRVHRDESQDGGRATHRFGLTDEGLEALRSAQRTLARMRDGLESILDAP